MPCHTRMKSIFLQGLLWLFLLQLSFMAVSLEPGYLDFDNLPDTNFSCIGRVVGGYYADTATACQMFHVCTLGQNNETMDIRFLCLNGTVFEQSTRVCERIDEVDCEKSEQFYHLNNELYGGMDPLIIRGEIEPIEAQTPSSISTSTSPSPSTTPNPYFGTVKQTTSHQNIPHHYTSDSPSDIRFDPKIINLQLNSDPSLGANIKPVSYQQQSYNDDQGHHTIVTTHSYKSDVPKTIYDNFKSQNLKPTDINYEFEYQDHDRYNPATRKAYQNVPSYAPSAGELDDYTDDVYKGSTYRNVYHTPSSKEDTSTYKTPITFTPSSNPQTQYSFERTELPIKQQQPTPPPSIFSALSSPAPFTHPHHLETKRNTDHHKIKKSFSLSISDQNGKELIKVNNTPISAIFPDSYLDYKDDEATLLPIFEDVPRLQKRRPKRSSENEKVFKADPEAADVLRFLANWYTSYEKTTKISIPLSTEAITEINDELSVTNEKEGNDSIDIAKEGEIENDVSDLQKRENEYYDDEYYYDDDDDDNDGNGNETSSGIIVSHRELENKEEIYKNGTKPEITLENNKNSTDYQEYVDDNYEAKTYTGDNQTLMDSNNTEIDINEILKDVPPTPDILYDYVDDNYEAEINTTVSERSKNISKIDEPHDILYDYVDDNYEAEINTTIDEKSKNISKEEEHKHLTSTTSTPIISSTPTTSTTIPQPSTPTAVEIVTSSTAVKSSTTTESELDDILTTNSFFSSTEESDKNDTTTDSNTTNHVIEISHKDIEDDLYAELIEGKEQSNYDEKTERINTTEAIEVIEYSTENKLIEEYVTLSTTSVPSTTTETTSTTENIPKTTTLYYHTQLSTEQSTFASPEEQASTDSVPIASSVMYKPEHTEVPIITTSYVTETSEQSSESTRLAEESIASTKTPVIVKESLNEMIKDIEVETKSIATTIVMPEAKDELPSTVSALNIGNIVTEYVDPILTTTIKSPTTVTTIRLLPSTTQSTTRPHFRGRPSYFTRKSSTTIRPSSHRFNLQRRKFDRKRNRPIALGADGKTSKISVNDVHIGSINITANNNSFTTAPRYKAGDVENKTVSSTENPKINHQTYFGSIHKIFGEAITDASLSKSANPTLAKETKHFLATTPISKHVRVKFKKERLNKFMFTCFDKEINRFYSDPRDCRLFHYCSQGYTSNQFVDMKFVCDLGTYFDDIKLICTEEKPARCL